MLLINFDCSTCSHFAWKVEDLTQFYESLKGHVEMQRQFFESFKGSDGRIDLSDEMRPLFHRAPTYPSPQQLTQDERPLEVKVEDLTQFYESLKDHVVSVKKLVELFEPTNAKCTLPPDTPTVSPVRKPSIAQDSNNLPSNNMSDQDAEPPKESTEETIPEPNSSDSGTEQDPAAVQDHDEDEPSDLQSQTASERPESVKADEDKESLPARGTSAPTAPLRSPLTQNSPNMESDAAGKPKEDTDSDQVTGEPAEESDRESDSSDLEKINGPHDSSEEKQSSTVPEEKGSEITVHEQDSNLPQHETHTQEGEHQEMNKQVSGVRNESENDPEDVAKELTSSQLPQIPTEPENHNTDTAHTQADKEKGDKTRHESDASEEQSDNSTAEANRGEGESEAVKTTELKGER